MIAPQVRDIQRKAEESEGMVQDICRDIKKLDFAKKHLTNTITALRRLAMLTAAVGGVCALPSCRRCLFVHVCSLLWFFPRPHTCPAAPPPLHLLVDATSAPPHPSVPPSDLEEVAGRRDQYKKCANLLEAVHQLMDYFQQYESIPKVWGLHSAARGRGVGRAQRG